MKTNIYHHLRCVLAVSALGVALAAPVRAEIFQMVTNYPAGTAAPYNAGGGVPAQPYITGQTITTTNATLRWYGMHGWYSVQSSPDLVTWTQVGNTIAATAFGSSYTVTNTLGLSGNFRLAITNSYSGEGNCSGCHGDKYTAWSGTAHAHAFADLGSSQNNSHCILCHTVGYGQPTGFTDPVNTPNLENVGCENCHGPAGWHKNSDHSLITPAVSMDPAICGSCHQGHNPQYNEYTNYTTELCDGATTFSHSRTSRSSSFGCAPCHQANNREVMLEENEDMLAGNSHSLTLYTGSDATAWTATCATCHDPHSSNQVAQLRYPTFSTNFFTMPTVTDVRTVLTTNLMGVVTTKSVSYNTVFDALYNPNIQVCGQCHNGRGIRWDGTAYGLVTNLVVSGPDTNTVYVDIYTTNTVTQVFTNSLGQPYLTNTYTSVYVSGRYATNVVTLSQTNPVVGVGIYAPLIAYTNGGVVYYSTNSSGFSSPHLNDQYNILIGILNPDYLNTNALGVATNMFHSHSKAPDQCTTCHVPNYTANGANVTGHSFVHDYNGCLTSCHSSYTADALTAKIRNLQFIETNNLTRVVSMLNQWALTKTTGTLLTNYGQLAWEFSSIGSLSGKYTNNGVKYLIGPPKAYSPALGPVPAGTNDNLQLLIPDDIRRARFNLYEVFADQSLGVHNPTYVQFLLDDAATRVSRQFTAANFSASTVAGFAPLTVKFTNLGTGITGYSWNFGDGNSATIANPTNIYNNPGIYPVVFTATTASGNETLMKTNYIRVLTPPVLSFVADQTNVLTNTTVNFSNTSTGATNVFRWTWYPMFGVSGAPSYDTAGSSTAFSFTYTNAGTYSVQLRATCPGGANGSYNRVQVTNTFYITVHN